MSDSGMTHGEAKADAKAAKSRAKAILPWSKKHLFMIPLLFLVLFIIIAAACVVGQ